MKTKETDDGSGGVQFLLTRKVERGSGGKRQGPFLRDNGLGIFGQTGLASPVVGQAWRSTPAIFPI